MSSPWGGVDGGEGQVMEEEVVDSSVQPFDTVPHVGVLEGFCGGMNLSDWR
jgi:hypothetical protein